ncbi:MAG: tRNA guanosine(34) transglycosylase Tgt [Deltaproteobacteria bacterium]|nr:MAG: tRNA guanosine(34) transglycosylase Tgt [Deltaproteobacteria bacterium]
MATPCSSFELLATCGGARSGVLTLPHGQVQTPAFMPVGTRGTVRGLMPGELGDAGADIVLANTYHLWDLVGHERIESFGGLHQFMGWDGPILTDSGGYQVFSFKGYVKVSEEGVRFASPRTGDRQFLSPELAVEIQETLGVDIAMAFDECIEWPADRDRVARSTERTTRWLHRCLAARRRPESTALFGIVQGGMEADLRVAHAQELRELDLDGYAIGGLSVGEGHDAMLEMVEVAAPELPANKARYLMGVGHPRDIVENVLRGVDMFDCVIPTRSGRHAWAFTSEGRRNLRNARYRDDRLPLDPACDCAGCRQFTRGYLRHLLKNDEPLGKRLVTLHNLTYYLNLMRRLREAIRAEDPVALEALRVEAHVASDPAKD